MGKYLVMVEDRTFFYTELNGFDITLIGGQLTAECLQPKNKNKYTTT